MRIGVLGTGIVGRTLANGFIGRGDEVMLGSRQESNPHAVEWAAGAGERASHGTFAEAAAFGEAIVVALLGSATVEGITAAKPANFAGKVVLDTTNPLEYGEQGPQGLFVGTTDSLGEMVQRALPDAHVVKCYNTVGNALMIQPKLPGGPPDMFVAGNDAAAKDWTREMLAGFGWNCVDLGGIEASRYLEPMCVTWVLYGIKTGTWNHAYKFLKT